MSGARYAIDTGGTFTDLIVENASGELSFFKSPTTPDDPVKGVLNVLAVAAETDNKTLSEFLSDGATLLHGTTRALNAVLSGKTARTAFLTTAGHPDVLLYREGGRADPFNFLRDFPQPYIPRALTWEIKERIGADGSVVHELDEDHAVNVIIELAEAEVEAVSVCLLWSPINGQHEQRIGELLEEYLPGIPYTLSHQLAPMLREYRRASAASLDASLKPLMSDYLSRLEGELREAGFGGRLLIVTSNGGVLDAVAVADAPILAINSGPSMAPVAGLHYASKYANTDTAVVADTGGTSYDVSLVRNGRIPRTRESWLGERFYGHMTGFPSVDISSIGAGGGSIAWVDDGGMLRIGPESAGADPGPACYGRGGDRPTVTDASVVLGYIDPDFFLGGKMQLNAAASSDAIMRGVGEPLGLDLNAAAYAIVDLATEQMVHAIEDVTVNHGVDPASAVLVAGGGAAGLNSVKIASRLGAKQVLFPDTGAVLSAAGALLADLAANFAAPIVTTSANFRFDDVNECLDSLHERCLQFIAGPGEGALTSNIVYTVDARYERQVWELEIPLPSDRFADESDVEKLVERFHQEHQTVFAVSDPGAHIELLSWNARVSCNLSSEHSNRKNDAVQEKRSQRSRQVVFGTDAALETPILNANTLQAGDKISGPAIIESNFTTVVIDPGSVAELLDDRGIVVTLNAANSAADLDTVERAAQGAN